MKTKTITLTMDQWRIISHLMDDFIDFPHRHPSGYSPRAIGSLKRDLDNALFMAPDEEKPDTP